MAKNQQAKSQYLDIYSALTVSHANIEGTLSQLKQPINQAKHSQEKLIEDLRKYITEMYTNVKLSLRNQTMKEDPTGILTNETIFSTLDKTKKTYPHWHLVPAIIQTLIDTDEDPIMPVRNKAKKAAQAAAQQAQQPVVLDHEPTIEEIVSTVATAQEANAVTKEGLSELDAIPAEVIIPQQTLVNEMTQQVNNVQIKPEVKTQVTATAEAIASSTVGMVTETVAIPVDHNIAFHIPFMADIEKTLLKMNDAFDENELVSLRSELGNKVRAWAEAFYKSIHDLTNPNRVTIDKVGILVSTTKYSQPELHAKFDYAHMVDKILARVNDKYKKTDTESSVHAMATALTGAQDESKTSFEVPTGSNESVVVHKETGNVEAKKDGKVVSLFKGIYKGVVAFFQNIWNGMKRFGAWIKSWFVKTNPEDRKDVTPEQAKQMEAEAIAKAQQIAATGQVQTPVQVVLPA